MKRLYTSALMLIALLAAALTAQAQSKSTFVHMKSGEIKEMLCDEIDSITFADHVDFDLDVKASHSMGIYHGTGQFVACISDGELDDDGLPTKAGQTVVLFYAFSDEADDPTNAQLASGVYKAGESYDKGTLYNGRSGYLQVIYCTGMTSDGPDGWQCDLGYATMNVKNNNGQYYIDFRGGISERSEDYSFKDVHMVFEGKIDFLNDDPSYYYGLTKDYNVVPTLCVGNYINSDEYGNYSLAFTNVPLDDEGYAIGAGELVNLELLTEPCQPMDISKIAGEYTITSATEGPWSPGNFLTGVNYNWYGYYMAIGTYINFYDENGASTKEIGFATGGTVKCSVDGDNITFDLNVETENGHKFTMNYTTSSSNITDYSASSSNMPRMESKQPTFKGLKSFTRKNLNNRPMALKLIKK